MGGRVWMGVAAALSLTSVACVEPTVVRVIDGREVNGRFVSSGAYALYARGAESEASGDLGSARLEYLAAAGEDEDSAEIWTRVGAVSCALGQADEAKKAFERALDRASDYEPAYRERAVCALAKSPVAPEAARRAFEDAARALELDPDSEEAALLYARAAELAGDMTRAERVLRERVVRAPNRAAGWRAFRDFAGRRGDKAAAARASEALALLSASEPADAIAAGSPSVKLAAERASLDEVDAAIARDAMDEARSAAKRAHLAPAELAVRAAALGHPKLAKAQAELVHDADPSNASAALALAASADMLHDDAAVTSALRDAAALTTPPSPLARLIFSELIFRRIDRDAARDYIGLVLPPPEGSDALLKTVSERVAASLKK